MFTSIPDQVGSFQNKVTLDGVTFSPGIYTINAVYQNKHDSVQFEILSDEAIVASSMTEELKQEPITISVDKELYEIGDTIIITGKVLPREMTSARSEVSKYDEQGKDDHYRPKVGTHVDYTNLSLIHI